MTARRRALSGQALAVAVGLSLVATGCSSKSSTSGAAPAASTTTAAAPAATTSAAAPAATSSAPAPAATGSSAAPSAPAATGVAPVVASAPTGALCTAKALGYPTVAIKGAKVGFAQSEPNTAAFRVAETKSMVDEAAKEGATLIQTDANSQTPKQVTDIESLINQGAQMLIVAPNTTTGLQPALDQAKAKKIPVVTVDRLIDSKPCTDYLTFIGSNFVEQGKRAADAKAKATGGKGKLFILLGAPGNGVTTDRTSGFLAEIKTAAPGLTIVKQQTGNFDRTDGQSVTTSVLQSNPDITAIYAENDEMGIGAHNALIAAGKKPGTDIKIVSIDGTKDAVSLIVKGEYNGVIESNPRFGALAFKALADFYAGGTATKIVITDDAYTPENAAAKVANAF